MTKLVAFRPGMDRDATAKEVDAFIMASLADFIVATGTRPAGAIVLWIAEDGSQTVSWCQAEARDIAFAAAHLISQSTE